MKPSDVTQALLALAVSFEASASVLRALSSVIPEEPELREPKEPEAPAVKEPEAPAKPKFTAKPKTPTAKEPKAPAKGEEPAKEIELADLQELGRKLLAAGAKKDFLEVLKRFKLSNLSSADPVAFGQIHKVLQKALAEVGSDLDEDDIPF